MNIPTPLEVTLDLEPFRITWAFKMLRLNNLKTNEFLLYLALYNQ